MLHPTGVFTGNLILSLLWFHRKLSTNVLRQKLANFFCKYFKAFQNTWSLSQLLNSPAGAQKQLSIVKQMNERDCVTNYSV